MPIQILEPVYPNRDSPIRVRMIPKRITRNAIIRAIALDLSMDLPLTKKYPAMQTRKRKNTISNVICEILIDTIYHKSWCKTRGRISHDLITHARL